MNEDSGLSGQPRALQQALALVLWLVSSALTVVIIAALRRFLLRAAIALSERTGGLHGTGPVDHWTVEAVDQFGVLVLGAAGLVFVLVSEPLYRHGLQRGRLWQRFGIVTAVQLGLLLLSLL
ncbi:MAG: hypothetical protein JXC32_18575 [Anaerolineae bacterium]|nr:hypothetical protein [Anaerolineae bacterium]